MSEQDAWRLIHSLRDRNEHEAANAIQIMHEQLDKAIAVLEMCQECIRGETPEDMTYEEGREYVISKIREIILTDETGK